MAKITITTTKGRTAAFELRPGLGFQALAARYETPLEFSCREADCGICILEVLSGAGNLTTPTAAEADFLKAMAAAPNERLACQCRILGDATVRVLD